MKKLLLVFVFIQICFFVNAQVGNRHFEPTGSFSICPPRNWTIQEVPGFKYKFFFGVESDGFTPNMNVVDEHYNGSLSEYVDLAMAGLRQVFSDARSTPKERFVTDSGLVGYKVVTTYTIQNIRLTIAQYFFSNNNQKIVLTCGAQGNSLGSFANLFDQSAKTFRIN